MIHPVAIGHGTSAPNAGTPTGWEAQPSSWLGLLTCIFSGVGEGTRTPDPQDHNLVL